MTIDQVNAALELIPAAMVWNNVRRIRKDKEVKGISLKTTACFCLLGAWYINYYGQMNQPWSMAAQGVFVLGNWLWFGHALYYSRYV